MVEYLRQRSSDSFLGKLNKYWPLLAALVSIIAMATTIKNKVDDHENRIQRLENGMSRIADNTDRLVNGLLNKKERDND